MGKQLKDWLNAALNLVYPAVCQICEKERATREEGYVCQSCWSGKDGVRFIVEPFCHRCGLPFEGAITIQFECANCREADLHFSAARSAVAAKGVVLDVIHRYKYGKAIWFEPFLADLLLRQAVPVLHCDKWDLIVPVPLHPVKQREREFNQAEQIAIHLSKASGLPMNKTLLRRVEPTRTQTQLTKAERAANVHNAFALNRGEKLNGEKVILVDDVFTTGATTSACAKILREAGARDVCVWTVARGI
ncbi:MAG: ComF family protein [Verrucomicrobia bacterium]|nr:ComF family protein [Verrucomicrobiota bacterium]